MRRTCGFPVAGIILLIVSLASAQSLGEHARKQRENKKTSASGKVYTNENLPAEGEINIVGSEPPAPAPEAGAKPEEKAGDKAESKPEAGKAAPPDAAKVKAGLETKAAELKKEITQLERELDVMNREFRLRAAAYYADAGNSLRDPKKWAEQQREYQTQTAEKQKTLDAAKQKLADLQEQARRSGVRIE